MLAFARSARKACRRPPDAEECLLDGVLGESLVPEDADCEAVRDSACAVVELGECVLVTPGDERDQSLVREVGVLLSHRDEVVRLGQR